MTKKSTPVKIIPAKKKTPFELILDHLDKHNAITKAIVSDYVGGPEMEFELETAYENLREAIEFEKDEAQTFDGVFALLEGLDKEDIDFNKILEFCKGGDFDTENVFKLVDRSDILDEISSGDLLTVAITNGGDRSKLEDFIKTEIYPFYNDQREYLNF